MLILADILITLLIVAGGFFALVGSVGLVKLPELMQRLHAPTKATTLGVGCVLLASMLYFLVYDGRPSVHELVITLFLLLTAPITANFIAKAYLHGYASPAAMPRTGRAAGWATFDPPRADARHAVAERGAAGPADGSSAPRHPKHT